MNSGSHGPTRDADDVRPLGLPVEVFNPDTKQFERNPEYDAQHAEGVRLGTHWGECWRVHLDCAVVQVERLKAALYMLAEDAEVAHQGGLHNDGQADG